MEYRHVVGFSRIVNEFSGFTIKRIWKNEYQRLPHISTLNMLTQLAFKTDWLALKKDFLEDFHATFDFTDIFIVRVVSIK